VNISNGYNPNNINIEVNFNPNKKASAVVMSDGLQIMNGVIQLRKITVNQSKMVYEVVFIGKLLNIFSVLGDKEISGIDEDGIKYLDFSEYDHYLTYQNQVDSWTSQFGVGYVYPLIDWGNGANFNSFGERIYMVGDLRPSYYAKTILDKIFDFAGFTYESSFLNGSLFNRLIVPITKPLTISDDNFQNKLFNIGKGAVQNAIINDGTNPSLVVGNQGYFINSQSKPRVCFSTESSPYFDNGVQTNGNYIVPSNPSLSPSLSYKWLVGSDAAGIYNLTASVALRCIEWGSIDVVRIQSGESGRNQFSGKLRIMRKRNNITEVVSETDWGFVLGLTIGYIPATTYLDQNAIQSTYIVNAENVEALIGDEFYVDLIANEAEIGYTNYFIIFHPDLNNYGSNVPYYLDFNIIGGYFANEYLNEGALEGELVDLTNNLPDVQMSDFLVSIFKMFNLYIEVDPDNDNNLLIETRDLFYKSGSTKDWTYKLARDKDISLEPLGLITDREYILTYTEDADYYNEKYQSNRGHTYGRARIEIDNDFVQSSNEIEVVFSPSPLVNDGASNRIIPYVLDSDIEEGAKPTDANVRIMYYGGLIPSDPSWKHRETITGIDHNMTEYPYAGHWDNPLTPTLDINFGLPYELYYQQNSYTGQIQVTNANLYNNYHRNYINEITDKDSKVMTAMFRLEPTDINKLDFRDQIVIDNSYWRINRVMNYNPTKEGLTKVELIKIKEAITFSSKYANINSTGQIGNATIPNTYSGFKTGWNKYPPFQGKVNGTGNNVSLSSSAFKVIGNDNIVGDGTRNITITGDNNYVDDGLFNVSLINTYGVKVYESNTTYVNNIPQACSKVVDGGIDEVRSLKACNPIFVIDGGADIVSNTFAKIGINIVDGGID